MFVSMRTKMRELAEPRRASCSVRFQKKSGGRKSALLHTFSVSSQRRYEPGFLPLE